MTIISIAMATYNGAEFIREQLESFVRQTRLPDELVICDDGSTDSTPDIVKAFTRAAPFEIRFECNPQKLGLNANFARAMALTNGDVVFLSDQDDLWYPEKIAVVEAAFAQDDRIASIIHDEHIGDRLGQRQHMTMLGQIRARGYGEEYHVAGNCTAHRRELLPLLLPVPCGAGNYDNWFAVALDALKLRTVIEEPLQLYRRHDLNTSDPEMLRMGKARATTALRYLKDDPRGGWAQEIGWREVLVSRLLDGAGAGVSTEKDIGEAVALNRDRIHSLKQRSELLGKTRLRRWPSVYGAWRKGLYRDFAGLQSMLKDLVRP